MGLLFFALSGKAEAQVSFVGTFPVNGFIYDYETGDYESGSFDLVIDEDYNIVEIAGYDLTEFINSDMAIKGELDGNSLVFDPGDGYFYLAGVAPDFTILGGDPWEADFVNEPLVFSYEDGEYSLTQFSIWAYNETDDAKEKLFSWTLLSIGEEEDPGEEPSEGLPYLGEYMVKGQKVTYTDGVAGEPEAASFLLTIVEDEDGDYGITTFAGYDVPDDWGYPGIYAWEGDEENIVEFRCGAVSLVEDGDLTLGSASTEEYEDDFVNIVFNTDKEGTVTDFTVWSAETNDYGEVISATIVASWSNLTFTAAVSGVKSIEAIDGEMEYYNLQGVKVQNPSKGIFVVRQGNTSKKVVIR